MFSFQYGRKNPDGKNPLNQVGTENPIQKDRWDWNHDPQKILSEIVFSPLIILVIQLDVKIQNYWHVNNWLINIQKQKTSWFEFVSRNNGLRYVLNHNCLVRQMGH